MGIDPLQGQVHSSGFLPHPSTGVVGMICHIDSGSNDVVNTLVRARNCKAAAVRQTDSPDEIFFACTYVLQVTFQCLHEAAHVVVPLAMLIPLLSSL